MSASFGFGGQLTTTCNLPAASGKNQSRTVHLRQVITETEVIDRAKRLQELAGDKDELRSFADKMAQQAGGSETAAAGWKALAGLFNTDSREELVTLLGFSKADIAKQVDEAINKFKLDAGTMDAASPTTPKDASAALADAETVHGESADKAPEATPSEFSITSDATKKTEAETEATEQSLFGENNDVNVTGLGGPNTAYTGADFFSNIGTLLGGVRLPERIDIQDLPVGRIRGRPSHHACARGGRLQVCRHAVALGGPLRRRIGPRGEGRAGIARQHAKSIL